MKRLIFALLLLPSLAFAEYDWRTGNSYNTTDNGDGSTTTRGNNYNNGSTWTNTTERDGDQRGRDANGNSWTYDAQSGRYFNYGTGKTCTGSGKNRTCY